MVPSILGDSPCYWGCTSTGGSPSSMVPSLSYSPWPLYTFKTRTTREIFTLPDLAASMGCSLNHLYHSFCELSLRKNFAEGFDKAQQSKGFSFLPLGPTSSSVPADLNHDSYRKTSYKEPQWNLRLSLKLHKPDLHLLYFFQHSLPSVQRTAHWAVSTQQLSPKIKCYHNPPQNTVLGLL